MGELRDKRVLFTKNMVALIQWGNQQPGWEVALGVDFDEADPAEKRRHMRGSLHYLGLANDLALYVGGVYQEATAAYQLLGAKWKNMHPEAAWGGDFKKADGNHFSIAYGGKK